MSKFTLVREDPDHRSSLEPMRKDNEIMFFNTPDEAYQYYRKEHYWDTANIQLVEFHDFKLELVKNNGEGAKR